MASDSLRRGGGDEGTEDSEEIEEIVAHEITIKMNVVSLTRVSEERAVLTLRLSDATTQVKFVVILSAPNDANFARLEDAFIRRDVRPSSVLTLCLFGTLEKIDVVDANEETEVDLAAAIAALSLKP